MVNIFKASRHVITGLFQFSFGAGLPWLQRSALEIPEQGSRFDKAPEKDFFFSSCFAPRCRVFAANYQELDKIIPLEPKVVQGKHFPSLKTEESPVRIPFSHFRTTLRGGGRFNDHLSRLSLFVFSTVTHHQNHVVPVT